MHRKILLLLKRGFQRWEFNQVGKWLFLGGLIGVVGGLGAWLFMLLLHASHYLFTQGFLYTLAPDAQAPAGHFRPLLDAPLWWLIPLIPAAGGLISGVLVYTWAPEAEGHGTDGVIDCYHNRRGRIRPRVPLIKTLASAAVIGSGGSAGREGPIAQIGAGFGSVLGQLLRVPVKERRLMVLAGAAAGISAIFQAPLGGAIFTTEVLYRNHELETEALIPGVIASLVSYSLYTRLVGHELLFHLPPLGFERVEELLAYAVLGLLCAFVGAAYVRVFYGLRDRFFRPLHLPPWSKPALGGMLLGVLAVFLPHVWGGGYDAVQLAMDHRLTGVLMLLLVAGKILATSFTISSGGSGGVFAPSLFIGAMLGGAVGQGLGHALPATFVPDSAAMVVVGMGGFFAGVAKVPIASLIMVSEMTGGYGLLVPMMLVSAISVLLTRNANLYEKQALATVDSPAHRGDFISDLLAGLTVRDTRAMLDRPVAVRSDTSLSRMFRALAGRKQDNIPVVDPEGLVTGMLALDELREVLFEGELDLNLVIAADVYRFEFPYLTPDSNLHEAITKFSQHGVDELAVLDGADNRLLGMLTRQEVILTYNRKLQAMKDSAAQQRIRRGGFV